MPYRRNKSRVDENILSDEEFENPLEVSNKQEKPSQLSILREESIKILRQNDNLDLDKYKQYIGEFYAYSGDIFEHDSNIFQAKKKDPTEILEMKLRRSLNNENDLVTRELGRKDARSISPEKIRNILNKLPPFPADVIPTDDIDSF